MVGVGCDWCGVVCVFGVVDDEFWWYFVGCGVVVLWWVLVLGCCGGYCGGLGDWCVLLCVGLVVGVEGVVVGWCWCGVFVVGGVDGVVLCGFICIC